LTFTEAAAREMQERIRARAFEAMAALPKEREAEWQAIKEGFDETWISTIHSFASRLIRESGLSLDLDPYSGVVSAPQEDFFWGTLERALECLELSFLASVYGDRVFSEIARRLENDEIFISALEKWGPAGLRELARGVTELHASVGHGHDTMLAWADDAESPNDPQAAEAYGAVLGVLRPRWDEAWELWRAIFAEMSRDILDAGEKAMKKAGQTRVSPAVKLAGVLERWGGILAAPEQSHEPDVRRAFYLDICENLSGDNSNLFKTIAGRLGQTASKWRDAQAEWASLSACNPDIPLSAAEQRLRAVLLRFSAFAWWAWDEMKRRRSLLSFSDMIRFAAQSVKNGSRPKGFRHVLIDEFQDTDPLQDAMIRALREKEGAKLFLVGDPKQAIYRFRHADLTLFADYVLQSRELGSDVNLDVSFRTRSSLMRTLNSLFAHIWRDGLGTGRMANLKFEPLSVPDQPDQPDQPERELAAVPPFTLLLSVRKGREAGAARERLAAALAGMMAGFVEEGRAVWDKENRCLRPMSWRDIAVLTPTRGEYGVLEAAFEKRGIPASFEKNRSYFSRGEVTDVVNVLRAAAFPDDETALAGWLSSPFSGVSQREAVDCLRARASSAHSLGEVLSESLPDAAERLSYLRRVGSLKGPSAVLSRLMEDRRYLAYFEPSQRFRVAANVNRAISSARQYERDVSHSLAGCAQWLDSALRAGAPAEEPDWMGEDADAVRVMTVHASKGLEFPVVAVMRMERPSRGRGKPGVSVTASKTLGVAFSDMPDERGAGQAGQNPVSMRWERALSAQSELEESQRLFYVAATRARDSLILCGVPGEDAKGVKNMGKDSWLSWTADWLAEEEGPDWSKSSSLVVVDESTPVEKHEKKIEYAVTVPAEPLELPAQEGGLLSSFSATSFALFEWCPFAWRRRHRQGLDLRWEVPDDLSSGDLIGGSELGSVAHWILARWDMEEDTLGSWLDGEDVVRRVPAVLRDTWRDGGNKEALREWLTAFAASGEGRSLASAARDGVLKRESAFRAVLRTPEACLSLAGAMDVLWRDGGRWHVRDYKITLSDNAPDELYRAQLAFYALVVKILAERRNLRFDEVDVGLIFLREGGRLDSTRRFPGDGDWAAMADRVTTAARGAAGGPWIPKRENCRRCPWRVKCPKRG
ncbi:MAG: UvrD-helicase domain-containing protein, partial [Synergistaceae bacterium]|nr:UvrD-helicase domain-containing protein [Synergistaceae bacterium]